MSTQQSRPEGHRISAPDGTGSLGGTEATIKQLRSQNDQLWKIIEKQKTVITNLQKDNQKLAHERDRLLIRIRDIDAFERSEENIVKGGNEIKVIADNVNDNTSTSDAIRIRTNTPPPLTSRLSKSFPQVQKQQIETELLTQSPQSQHQDSETLIISETALSSSLNAFNESNSSNLPPVVVHEPSPERLNFEHEKDSEHQLDEIPSRNDSKSASSQNDIVILNLSNANNPQQSLSDNNISGSPIDTQILPSPLNLDQSSQNSRLQHTHSSNQNPPSPSMSTKSSESESLSSGSCSRHRRQSTIQTIDTELDILEETDTHVQFPQPPLKDSSTKPPNQHINIQSSEVNDISDNPQDSPIQSLKKVPEPLGLVPQTQKLGTPQRSPGLPSSPKAYMYSNDEQPPQRISNENDATASSRNIIIDQDNLNYNKYLQSVGHNQIVERSQPIRSHSLPNSDDKTYHEKSEDEGSRRDSQTSNNESLGINLKDKSLRASRSFSHVPTGPRSRISMMPPPHGGYPEFRNTNPNNVSLPNQGQIDNPSVNLSQGQQWQSFQAHPQQTTTSSSQQSQLSPRSETSTPSITSDAISGIAVKVVGSNKKTNDKGKEVLTFIISVGQARVVDGRIVGMEKELWRVEKFYSDFLSLDGKLKQRHSKNTINKIGKLPDKNLFHNNAPSKVDQRKVALEQYLQHIISLPLRDSNDLCKFLSTNVIEQDDKDYQQTGYKEGYLTKKGKSFGGWKSRFFVLKSPILEYYESKDGSHLGSIRLTHAQIGRQQSSNDTDKDNENSYRHAFLILEPKPGSKTQNTRHVLCAESDAERDEWVEALLQYVGVTEEEAQRRRQKKEKEKQMKDTNKAERKKGNNDSISSTSTIRSEASVAYGHQNDQISQNDQWSESKNVQPTLGVSVSHIQKRSSMLEEIERIRKYSGTPEPRDASPSSSQVIAVVSSNSSSQGSSTRRDRPHDDQTAEKRKNSRKTFFGSMFGSKDDKKKYNEIRPDVSKIVFGIPLDQAIAVARIKEGYELPAVVFRCIEYLDANDADKEEGIYRLSGAAMTLKHLKDRFNVEGDVDLLNQGEYYDVHAVAGLLKLYLRELPTSVLTRELHMEFVNVVDLLDRRDRINELGRLVSSLPLANYTLLRALTGHLIRVVQNSEINKMTVRNIGIVFSPTLGIPAGVFSLFMAEFDYIFTNSNGVAAPKTIEANHKKNYQPSTNVFSTKSTSDNQQLKDANPNEDPTSPTALRRREITSRSNRNGVYYMNGASDVVVVLERKLSVTKSSPRRNERNDDSLGEDVNYFALQVEDIDYDAESVSSASIEEFITSSPPDSSNFSLPSLQLPQPNYNFF
ncbi:10285_t:CDS:2 [Cetraspora pellucida]|uniref:10285_t:CDS:1 n=1 Tax=Cetraspora pellucida TaxID=1433469 RepID=A0ACA9LX19_9GLOM|nr:10285_t:CDS:2 [Cetraspora pellucida]